MLSLWSSMRRWLAGLVAEAPADIDRCEYDCKNLDCRAGDWQTCEHRPGSSNNPAPGNPASPSS